MPPKKTKPKEDSQKTEAAPKPESRKSTGKTDIANGDVITLDFDAWIINPDGTDELFDTTSEEHAKAGEIFNEKAKYGPIVTIAGDERVLPGLDKSFLKAKIGEKSTVSIPPSDGAGDRQPNMVEIFSVRELQKQEIDPEPGMRVQIKNKVGTITNVTSGRVRVDFNDPLAGKTLKYDYSILKKAETPEEKALGIVEADYGDSKEFKAKVDGEVLEMVLSDRCKYDQLWFTLKYKVVSDLRQFLNVKTIRFIDEYVKKEEPKAEASTTEPAAEPEESEVLPEAEEKKE
ncbi:MAG: peptidylprolyl isomerase [Thermoplasmata archaeon]